MWRARSRACRRAIPGPPTSPTPRVPFDRATLDTLYPTHAHDVPAVALADARKLRAGRITAADARADLIEAIRVPVGRR